MEAILGWLGCYTAASDLAANSLAAITSASDWEVRLNEWIGPGYYASDVIMAPQLLGLWPLYGFCFGQFFGLICAAPLWPW